jgi:alpha-N-arabinofuranosidase
MLDDVDSPTFLGRRQEHNNFTATTSLKYQPSKSNEEAGITVLMNDRYHFDLVRTKGKVILRYQLGSITHLAKELAVNTDKVQLWIEGSENFYTFSHSVDGIKFVILGKADTNLISTETAGGFAGIYLGLFTSGNGTKCNSPALFDWFDYKRI